MNKETSIIKRNAKDSMIQIRHIQIICGILKIRDKNCINQITFYHFIMRIIIPHIQIRYFVFSKISTIYGLIILKLSMAS